VELEKLQADFANDPSGDAYYHLIARYVELGRVVEALVVAKKAAASKPQDSTAARMLGWVLLVQNKVDRALTELLRSLQLDAGDYEARFLYGLGLERQERLQEAQIQFDYVLLAHPQHPGATEAKGRCANPQPLEAEERDQVVEKTIMMAAVDILSSRDMTSSTARVVDKNEQPLAALADEAKAAVDEGIKARQNKEERAEREELVEPRQELPEQSKPNVSAAAPQATADPAAKGLRNKALFSAGLAILVVGLLSALYNVYSGWAANERALQERFAQAERSFLKHQPAYLLQAFSQSSSLAELRPQHHLAIGLAAHAAARLASEFGWQPGWDEARSLLKRFPAGLTSIHHRSAVALVAAKDGDFSGGMAALQLTAHGRALNLPIFRNLRGLLLHHKGRNADARKAFQDSVANGAEHPELNLHLSRFELETGHPGVAQAYAGRLLAAADQARGEAETKAASEFQKALKLATKNGGEPPTKAEEVPGNAFAAIEHGPALLLRAASWMMRSEALAKPALSDLRRSLALPICSDKATNNCVFEGQRQTAHALQALAFMRLAKVDQANEAKSLAKGSFDSHPWVLVGRSYFASDDGRSEEALSLAATAAKLLPHSALPLLARAHAQIHSDKPGVAGDELAQMAKIFASLKGQTLHLSAELLARSGDRDGALAQADAYLATYPDQKLRSRLLRSRVLRWSKAYDPALKSANETLQEALRAGRMNLGHGALIEIMRLELRRGGKGSALRAFKDLTKDNPNHSEALFLAARILRDNDAKEHLLKIAPGSAWAIKIRKP
jgi:predicted Zn-dependent protease